MGRKRAMGGRKVVGGHVSFSPTLIKSSDPDVR